MAKDLNSKLDISTFNTEKTALTNSINSKASKDIATVSANGLMSSADKTKLNGIATGANAYTHPTSSGNKHIPSGGASGQFLKWSSDGTAVWASDNNTTYSAGTGLSLSGTTFSANIGTGSTQVAAGNHTHNYLPLTGGTVTGKVTVTGDIQPSRIYFKNSVTSMNLAMDDKYLVFKGRKIIKNDGNVLRMQTNTAGGTTYLDWFTDAVGTTRSAWMGYGTRDNNNFAISVENGGELHLSGTNGVVMKSPLNMETRAIRNIWQITGKYNDKPIIVDHGNSNVTVSALGGALYLGYENTSQIRLNANTYGKGHHYIVDSVGGTNYIFGPGNYDAAEYGKHNFFTKCWWSWGIETYNGLTNMYFDARLGKFIGKGGAATSCSRDIKSDIRAIGSENQPMAINLRKGERMDTRITLETIIDFLDSLQLRTYAYDYAHEGFSQDEIPEEAGGQGLLQLGFIADDVEDHPLFKYVGVKHHDGLHSIDTMPMIAACVAGYKAEKFERMNLQAELEVLRQELVSIKEKL